jgi:hypothetical protein
MSKIIYTADKYDRMSQPENPLHDYTITIRGETYAVRASSQRGAELRAQAEYEREYGPQRW